MYFILITAQNTVSMEPVIVLQTGVANSSTKDSDSKRREKCEKREDECTTAIETVCDSESIETRSEVETQRDRERERKIENDNKTR